MEIILDIGFTLVGGRAESPPKVLAREFQVPKEQFPVLYDVVFTQDHRTPESLCLALDRQVPLPAGNWRADVLREIWERQYEIAFALPGASEFLERLNAAGGFHIASNLWFPFYDAVRTLFGPLWAGAKTETLSFAAGLRKPDPGYYDLLLRRIGRPAGDCIMVGDSFSKDIRPMLEHGATCIWYLSRPRPEDEVVSLANSAPNSERLHLVRSLDQAQDVLIDLGCELGEEHAPVP